MDLVGALVWVTGEDEGVVAAVEAARLGQLGAREARLAGRRAEGQRRENHSRGDELHCGAYVARERAPVPIARLSSGAVRTVVMTVSTSVSRREAEDLSGPKLAHLAEDA